MNKVQNTDKQRNLYKIAGVLFILAFAIGAFSGHISSTIVFLPLGIVFIGLAKSGKN